MVHLNLDVTVQCEHTIVTRNHSTFVAGEPDDPRGSPYTFLTSLAELAAFAPYFVGRKIIGNYVLTFIATLTLCAFDFLTVKNISGR